MTDVPHAALPERIVLLDGGMGLELHRRGVPIPDTIWSANALVVSPETVGEIHLDYIDAGADVIITNTYGLIRAGLAKEGIEDRFAELNLTACTLAQKARAAGGRSVLIAGALPPLAGSYRPDRAGAFKHIEPLYREQAEILMPHVDLFLCETMSSAAEGCAAATAAASTGRPVWVSWTLHEDASGRLRSGETITEAAKALDHLPISGFMVNCCLPESITAAMIELVALGKPAGGYANTFVPVSPRNIPDGDKDNDVSIPLREDLDPIDYARHAGQWLDAGARIIGGCCGTSPDHIARLRELIV